MLFDIDHFKRVNDTQGHTAGDQVLCDVATVSARQLRASEQIFRIGGEEFAIVVQGDRNAAVIVAERVRLAIQDEPRQPRLPTLSAGVAAFPRTPARASSSSSRPTARSTPPRQHGRNTVSAAA